MRKAKMLRWRLRVRVDGYVHIVSDELDARPYIGAEDLPSYVLERVAVLMLLPEPEINLWNGQTPLTEVPGVGNRMLVPQMPRLGDVYWIDDTGFEDA
jgi:hypothetical protein